jgi:hypothetical protein
MIFLVIFFTVLFGLVFGLASIAFGARLNKDYTYRKALQRIIDKIEDMKKSDLDTLYVKGFVDCAEIIAKEGEK